MTIDGFIDNRCFCEAYCFKCLLSSDDQLSVEETFFEDLLEKRSLTSIRCILFNVTGDKILIKSNRGYCLVLCLETQSVISCFEMDDDHKLIWAFDFKNDDILISFDKDWGIVYVYSIDHENKFLNELSVIEFSTLFGKLKHEELYYIKLKVSPGNGMLVLGFKQCIYLVDPFTGLDVCKLDSVIKQWSDGGLYTVQDIQINWCSNEIIVLHRETSEGKLFVEAFHMNTGRLESLLESSLKTVLLNYSMTDLKKINL